MLLVVVRVILGSENPAIGIPLNHVLRQGTLPKLPSGKAQRFLSVNTHAYSLRVVGVILF